MDKRAAMQGSGSLATGLPSWVCVGPQRTGTSWLDQYLRWRGDVCLPQGIKETAFFDRRFELGVQFYRSHFQAGFGHSVIGEICPTYFDSALARARILSVLGPSTRILCTLRNPIDRTLSLYRHLRRYGQVQDSFRAAIASNPRIVDSSRYAQHLEGWFADFGRHRVGVVFLENLQADPDGWVRQVCAQLQLPFIAPPAALRGKINAGTEAKTPYWLAALADQSAHLLRRHGLYGLIDAGKALGLKALVFGRDGNASDRPDDTAHRAWVQELLQADIESLETLLGCSFASWKEPAHDRAAGQSQTEVARGLRAS